MTEYDNTNRGSIWKNEKMRPDKNDPEFTGSLNVNGAEYWVSAWKRKHDASDKAPALSFSIKRKEKDAKPASNAPTRSRGASNDEFSDDIPF
jgi:hypothetical protein